MQLADILWVYATELATSSRNLIKARRKRQPSPSSPGPDVQLKAAQTSGLPADASDYLKGARTDRSSEEWLGRCSRGHQETAESGRISNWGDPGLHGFRTLPRITPGGLRPRGLPALYRDVPMCTPGFLPKSIPAAAPIRRLSSNGAAIEPLGRSSEIPRPLLRPLFGDGRPIRRSARTGRSVRRRPRPCRPTWRPIGVTRRTRRSASIPPSVWPTTGAISSPLACSTSTRSWALPSNGS